MNIAKTKILGLSWRKLGQRKKEEENEENSSPTTRRTVARQNAEENKSTFRPSLSLRRMQSFRDAVGTLRQKLRTSTRRRKRLINSSPYTPKRYSSTTSTPSSVQRRSARIAQIQEDRLYSPFNIDSPSRTPSTIRMGTHRPKRFNFSSPGQVVRDVNSLTEGIQVLTDMSDRLNAANQRSGIRTTPKVPRAAQRKPVFV